MATVIQGNLATPIAEAVEGALNVQTQHTVGLARTQVTGGDWTGTMAKQSVCIQASLSNTGTVYVGSSDVTSTKCAAELAAGASYVVSLQDPSKLWCIGSVTTQKANVSWV